MAKNRSNWVDSVQNFVVYASKVKHENFVPFLIKQSVIGFIVSSRGFHAGTITKLVDIECSAGPGFMDNFP